MADTEFHPNTSANSYPQPWGQQEVQPWSKAEEDQWMEYIASRAAGTAGHTYYSEPEKRELWDVFGNNLAQTDPGMAESIVRDIVRKQGLESADGSK